MANTCSICKHKKRAEIEAALARGQSSRPIASQFGVGYKSVQRHQDCIAEQLQQARKAAEDTYNLNLDAELRRCLARANKLLEACDSYLTDPEDHNRYSLEPRATDVTIIYTVPGDNGKSIRKKEGLSTLIARMEKSPDLEGFIFERAEIRRADPRELVLKTIDRLLSQIDVVAKLTGAFKEPQKNPSNQRIDLIAIMIEEQRELGREITREEADRLLKEETEHFIRLARKTGQEITTIEGVQ